MVIIHWCSLRLPTFIPAQESTWVKNIASFVSEVPNIICIAASPLLISNGMVLGWIVAEHLDIQAGIINTIYFFEVHSLSSPSFLFFHTGVLSIFRSPSSFVSLVVQLIIGQVMISSKMRAIEVIHSPMWAMRIDVFSSFLCETFVPTSHWITTSYQYSCRFILGNNCDWIDIRLRI